MSITLNNGTVLPDIPAKVLAEYPYVIIAEFMGVTIGGNGLPILVPVENKYLLCASPGAFFYAAKEHSPYGFGMAATLAGSAVVFTATAGEADWNETTDYMFGANAPGDDVLQWANHDICYVTFSENGDPVVSTEVYFADSTKIKPLFVLPDGTELPALPDGCFDGTPYGFVVKSANDGDPMYFLSTCTNASVFVPSSMSSLGLDAIFSPGEGFVFTYFPNQADSWVLFQELPMNGALVDGYTWLVWANHDTLTATTFNEADMSYTVGTEIAHKSDENYRVTGGYMTSIANEARRLGGKTGGMLPAVTEATLRGVTVGGSGGDAPGGSGGDTPGAHWLETAWGQDEFSYEIPFPISIVEDMETWFKNASAANAFKSINYDPAANVNTCNYYGAGGGEIIGFHKALKAGKTYTFSIDYFTSTGSVGQYSDAYAPFIAFMPEDMVEKTDGIATSVSLAHTVMSNNITQDYVTYTCAYTPDQDKDVYISLVGSCIGDNTTWNFKMKNIKVTEV